MCHFWALPNQQQVKIWCQKYLQMGYNYLIEEKTLWEKGKLLIMSNFLFSHNVFKGCLLLMRQNEYLWSRGLSDHKETPSSKHNGKLRKYSYPEFSPFPDISIFSFSHFVFYPS